MATDYNAAGGSAPPNPPVMMLATEEARALGHGYVDAEHMLLALARPESATSAELLKSRGATLEGLRKAVAEASPAPRGEVPEGQLPITSTVMTLLQTGLEEAKLLGREHVDKPDFLLALLRPGAGVAGKVLAAHGIGYMEVFRALGGGAAKPEAKKGGWWSRKFR